MALCDSTGSALGGHAFAAFGAVLLAQRSGLLLPLAPVGMLQPVLLLGAVLFHYDPLRVYKVRGTFEAGLQRDTAYGVSLFRLCQARVEEAVGAKIMKIEEAAPAPAR